MAYKAISKAEAKRFVHEVRKAHDVIIERIYAHKDTVTAANNGLAPKLPDNEIKFLNGKGEWVIPPNDVYTLQSASDEALGGVKIADNTGITIGSSGVISVVPASSSVIGGIKFPTTNLNNTYLRGDGTWATPTDTKYTLPVATTESLGGVIVGDNISVDANGRIGVSIPGDNTTYLRGDGTWATPTDTQYTLPVATNESLGGVIVGDNISVDANGRIGVSVSGDNTTYLRGDGTWGPISLDDYKGPVTITVTENRNTLAQSIATNGITSNILQTLTPNIINIESPNEGDKYLVSNTDPLLDIYEGDYIIYQEDTWRYIKSSGLRSKSLSFKGYIESSQDLEQIATINNDSISSSEIQSNNSAIGNMWLMKTTLGSLEQGDLLLRTGPGTNDWKIIHERPISSSGSGGVDFTAGRGLDLASNNILNVDFTNCSGANAIPASNVVFDISYNNYATASLQIETTHYVPYIDIVQGPDFDGVRIGGTVNDYYFEGDSGGNNNYYYASSDDYYYYSGSDDSGGDDYYY